MDEIDKRECKLIAQSIDLTLGVVLPATSLELAENLYYMLLEYEGANVSTEQMNIKKMLEAHYK